MPRPVSPVIQAIREEMERQGMSGYRLAREAGVRTYTVQRIVAGKGSPTLDTLEAIAKALGMTLVMNKPE